MNSLIAVSLWIALVTVVPGLITIATVFGAFAFVDPEYTATIDVTTNEWIWSAIAVTIMILTQGVGILLEDRLVTRKKFGRQKVRIDADLIPKHGDDIDLYEEYHRLYLLLVRMKDDEDPSSHLERAVAQFFLTNNTLVSFGVGILATVGILLLSVSTQGASLPVLIRGGLYMGLLLGALAISFRVAATRFRVMTLSMWAFRTNPARDPTSHPQPGPSVPELGRRPVADEV